MWGKSAGYLLEFFTSVTTAYNRPPFALAFPRAYVGTHTLAYALAYTRTHRRTRLRTHTLTRTYARIHTHYARAHASTRSLYVAKADSVPVTKVSQGY